MIDVPVSAVTTESAPIVPPDTTAVEAARRLRRADVHAVVVHDAGAVAGIVTESDIVAVVAEGGENPPVESFMSSPVVTVAPSTPVGLAADRMRDAGVTCLPVVEGDGEGPVSRGQPAQDAGDGERPASLGQPAHDAGDGEAPPTPRAVDLPADGVDGRYRGLVTRRDIAPYLSRHRLDVDWGGEPLSLDGSGRPEPATE